MTFTLTSAIRRAALAGLLGLLATAAQAQTISSFSPQGGRTGTQITLTGLALANTSAVLLNGQPMPIVSKSATQVVVKIPAAASSGKLLLVSTVGGVSTSTLSSNVLFATRSSAGTYLPQVGSTAVVATPTTGTGTYSTPTFADFNNDGLQELVVGYADGTIKSYSFSTGTGNYGAAVTLTNTTGNTVFTTVAGTAGNYAKPTITDLDGNGRLDLIVGTGTNQTLARYEQQTAGGTAFGAQQLLTASYTNSPASFFTIDMGYNFPRPVVTDLDGNGKLDLIVGDDNGQLARFEQIDNTTNAGRFTTLSTSTAGFSYLKLTNGTIIDVGFTSKPQVTDLDGNGKIDLLVGSRAGNVLRYEQSATNSIAFNSLGTVASTSSNTAIKVGTAGTDNNYAAPAIGDVDGDGVEDLAVGSNDGTILRYEQAAVAPAPLPVVLTGFTAQATTAGVRLSWITAQEKNSAAFYVERSFDGKTFASVGDVAAAGTSTSAHSYQFLDAAAATGTRYYRLRQVDQDGTTNYSAVVTVTTRATVAGPGPDAYPNPFAEALYVALPAGTEPQAATAVLLNLAGQPVFSTQVQLQATPQLLSGLPALAPGIYVLRLTTATGSTAQRLTRR